MSEYVIQKKTKCEQCDGTGSIRFFNEDTSIHMPCKCANGFIYAEVNLLDVLKRVRWELRGVGSEGTFDYLVPDRAEIQEVVE